MSEAEGPCGHDSTDIEFVTLVRCLRCGAHQVDGNWQSSEEWSGRLGAQYRSAMDALFELAGVLGVATDEFSDPGVVATVSRVVAERDELRSVLSDAVDALSATDFDGWSQMLAVMRAALDATRSSGRYVQTRDDTGELLYFTGAGKAFEHARTHPKVWKISWPEDSDTRVRLVRVAEDLWRYAPLMEDYEVVAASDLDECGVCCRPSLGGILVTLSAVGMRDTVRFCDECTHALMQLMVERHGQAVDAQQAAVADLARALGIDIGEETRP